ncbi:helix-turn-helix domain-containing protein [Streptomyces sp. NPDC088124]|uniref:helix-turn-helix domain-containing protein n=1 Tax=Streptomyces sp. NPDC088124 TaxID=3154654 RepID=UPI003417284B
MTTRTPGNIHLKAARVKAGFSSQSALADALRIGTRQVSRWERDDPPWPQPDQRAALTALLGQTMEQLGFTDPDSGLRGAGAAAIATAGLAAVPIRPGAATQPASVAVDFRAVTHAHRHLYWSLAPAALHPAVIAHATLGCAFLAETDGQTHRSVATALAETWLLAGRIEFFDLNKPEQARATLQRALQAASEAQDDLMGSAILAHTAFIPGWAGQREDALETMAAARAYARRATAGAEFWAWLDAVEAECETHCGNMPAALQLITRAEETLDTGPAHARPAWMDWFSPVRLAGFKGNAQLRAGHLPQARATLLTALDDLPEEEGKQRSVIYGDLAAVEAADGRIQEACDHLRKALAQLEITPYAAGRQRVRDVRRALVPHQDQPCVRDFDEVNFGWNNTVSALAR